MRIAFISANRETMPDADSGCDEMPDRLRKGFRTDKIRRLSAIAKSHGLRDCHSFILGTTGETLEHVERTLDFVEELDPFAAVMLVWVEDSEVVNPQIELERRHFRDEIYERIRRRAERQTRWVVPTLGIRFNARTFAVRRKLRLRGPLWQYLDRLPARGLAAGTGSRH